MKEHFAVRYYNCSCGCTVTRDKLHKKQRNKIRRLTCNKHPSHGVVTGVFIYCTCCGIHVDLPMDGKSRINTCIKHRKKEVQMTIAIPQTNPRKQAISYYECECGCINIRSQMGRSNNYGIYRGYCLTHKKTGGLIRKFTYCMDCGEEFDIPISTKSNLSLCADCLPEASPVIVTERKWDCKHYENCLFNKPKQPYMECTKCSYHEIGTITLKHGTHTDNNVDDMHSWPSSYGISHTAGNN